MASNGGFSPDDELASDIRATKWADVSDTASELDVTPDQERIAELEHALSICVRYGSAYVRKVARAALEASRG